MIKIYKGKNLWNNGFKFYSEPAKRRIDVQIQSPVQIHNKVISAIFENYFREQPISCL